MVLKVLASKVGLQYRALSTRTFRKVTHCIFDMDGLLLDTELVYRAMVTKLCARYGHEYTPELMLKVLGGSEQRLSEVLCAELRLPCTPQAFRDQLLALGDSMLAGAPLMPGAERLLRHLGASGVPTALATSSSERSVRTKERGYEQLFSVFSHRVMASSDAAVARGKPSPDVFLVAADRFPDKPSPQQCLVFEDSPAGVAAALAARMQVVMVPDAHLPAASTTHARAAATLVLPSLLHFRPELFHLPPFPPTEPTAAAA